MVVNYEFLGGEPIENLITCMNFEIDKVVFFGYQDMIDAQKADIVSFLKNYCKVKTVAFLALPHNDLDLTLNIMRREIQNEKEKKNQVYFDITGGESLILVAFGMLSKEFEAPMHLYDIDADKLIDFNENAERSISRDVKKQNVPMTLDLLIKMHGGKINTNLQKNIKSVDDALFMQDVEKIFAVAKANWAAWNPFSDFLRNNMAPQAGLEVCKRMQTVINGLSSAGSEINSIHKLNRIVDALAAKGILTGVLHDGDVYRFRFKNENIKECLWEGGSILELHTCLEESKHSDECRVGVHLDWDGIDHVRPGQDVLNEIDVISLKGNIPTFISCKSGKMESNHALHALYELETVAERFGGKYAKKVLVCANGMADIYMERAKEMGIEVR